MGTGGGADGEGGQPGAQHHREHVCVCVSVLCVSVPEREKMFLLKYNVRFSSASK